MNKYLNRKEVENTPFAIVGDEKEWSIAVGSQLITEEKFESEEEAYEYVMKRPWELIINITAMYTEFRINQITNNLKK